MPIKEQLPVIDIEHSEIDSGFIREAEGSGGIVVDSTNYVTGKITPIDALDVALRSLRKRKQFDQIIYEWPFLNEAAINMTKWISPILPGPGGDPLLRRCLASALEGYRHMSQLEPVDIKESDPYVRLRTFILVASKHFDFVLQHDIYGACESGAIKWRPFDKPIMDWIVDNEHHHLLIVPAEIKPGEKEMMQARNKLLYEIFDFTTLALAGIVTADENVISVDELVG